MTREELVKKDIDRNIDYKCDTCISLKMTELKKENAELKEQVKEWKALQELYDGKAFKWQGKYDDVNKQLTKAKDIIRNLLRVTYGEGWNYSLDWKVKAEQFLNSEVEK